MLNHHIEPLFPAGADILTALGLEGEVSVTGAEINNIEDLFRYILETGGMHGVRARAEVLVEELQERTEIIRHKLMFVEDRPSVACISSFSPVTTAGGIVPGLIRIAGGTPLEDLNDYEALKQQNPDIIVIAIAGYPVEKTVREIHSLLGLEGWGELNAVKNNQVYIADGEKYFYCLSTRIVDSLEILAELIQPKQFIFGFQDDAWVKFGV